VQLIFTRLPTNNYMALRLISIEIIEDLSYILQVKDGQFMWGELSQFLEFIIPALHIPLSENDSSLCFKKIC